MPETFSEYLVSVDTVGRASVTDFATLDDENFQIGVSDSIILLGSKYAHSATVTA